MKSKISIIIPTYNEEKDIVNCLKSIRKQTYKNLEIIVVDDGSSDRTVEIVNEFKEVKILKQDHKGPGAAKNRAIKIAKGEIFAFVDADEILKKDYIEELIEPIIKKKCFATVGVYMIFERENPWARCAYNNLNERMHQAPTVFRAILTKKFLEIGGFDPKKGYSDDQVENIKKIQRVKKAIFYHNVDSSLKEIYHKAKWIGQSLVVNPKSEKSLKTALFLLFWVFLSTMLLFFSLKTSISFILITIIIYLAIKSIKKIIHYKDVRLLFYYPLYKITYVLGMIRGFTIYLGKKLKNN